MDAMLLKKSKLKAFERLKKLQAQVDKARSGGRRNKRVEARLHSTFLEVMSAARSEEFTNMSAAELFWDERNRRPAAEQNQWMDLIRNRKPVKWSLLMKSYLDAAKIKPKPKK